MFGFAFSGFLRFSELSLVRSKDVDFGKGFTSIFIEKSTADQLREGQSVVIAESGSSIFPVTLLKLCMENARLCFDSDDYHFRPISSRNRKRLVSVNKPITYSTYGEPFKRSLYQIFFKFSTLSGRSGGTTLAANSGVSDRNVQRHGRWASVSAKNTRVKDSLVSRL